MDPLTLLAIGGMAIKGASIIGDYMNTRAAGEYQNRLANINANIMQMNAMRANQQAALMSQLGAAQAGMFAAQASAVQQIAAFNARNVRTIAAYEAEVRRREYRKLIGAQRARYGTSGVQVNTGSPLAVQKETAELGELDALMLLRNGEAQAIAITMDGAMQAGALNAQGAIANMEALAGAHALRTEAAIGNWQAGNLRMQGAYDQQAANFQAKIGAIGGIGELGMMAYGGFKSGVFGGSGGGGSSFGSFGSTTHGRLIASGSSPQFLRGV